MHPVAPPGVPERRPAFSLVLSLTVMAMLLLLCIGVAALMAVELRVAGAAVSRSRARMNALAGARIAQGELQRLLGPDRAVSANAAILADNKTELTAGEESSNVRRPRYVGVWKGLLASGLPAVSPLESYAQDHDKAFAGWLASGTTDDGKPLCTVIRDGSATPAQLTWMKRATETTAVQTAAGAWVLLGGDTPYQGAPALANRDPVALCAKPENFRGAGLAVADDTPRPSGAFAWVVMDENQKARADLRRSDDTAASDRMKGLATVATAAAFHIGNAADGASFSLRKTRYLTDAPQLRWNELPLDNDSPGWFPVDSDGAPARALRHDFTTESVSLLTDTANGGLKRDLGLMALLKAEDFDALPDLGGVNGQIGFEGANNGADTPRAAWWRTVKTQDIQVARVDPNVTNLEAEEVTRARLWPIWSDVREWATFATTALGGSADTHGAVQPFLSMSGGRPMINAITYPDFQSWIGDSYQASAPDRHYQADWRQPILAKYRVEFRLVAKPGTAQGQFDIVPRFNICAVLWNPYDVRLKLYPESTNNRLEIQGVNFPVRLRLTTAAASAEPNFTSGALGGKMPLYGTEMEPGEFRVFSTPNQDAPGSGYSGLGMTLGYSTTGGVTISGQKLLSGLAPDAQVQVEFLLNDKFRLIDNGSYSNLTLYRNSSDIPGNDWLGIRGVDDKSATNATKMLVAGGSQTLSVAQMSSAAGQPVGVFEYRLKTEKNAGAGTNTRIPVGDYRSVYQVESARNGFAPPSPGQANPNASDSFWNLSSMEFVAWPFGGAGEENPDLLQFDGTNAFGGSGYSAASGLTRYVARHIPLHPPVSTMELTGARLGGGWRPMPWFATPGGYYPMPAKARVDYQNGMNHVRNAFGNSLQNPWIPSDKAVSDTPVKELNFGGDVSGRTPNIKAYDMSWILNAAIADTWFTSSLGAWDRGACKEIFGESRTAETMLKDFFSGARPLPNSRYEPLSGGVAADFVKEDETAAVANANDARPHEKLAAKMLVTGGFNINSTSVRAWRAFLASAYGASDDKPGLKLSQTGNPENLPPTTSGLAVLKTTVPNSAPTATPQSATPERCNGGIILTDAQLDKLAQAIVSQVKQRGPFLSVGEFLNRRIETGELGVVGAVQAAIRKAGLEDYLKTTGYTTGGTIPDIPNPEAGKAYDHSGTNSPGWLAQADLLRPLMTAVTPRGDTFVVRVAASAEDGAAPTAHHEITLRRTYAYLDASDSPETAFSKLKLTNKVFGRRFEIVAIHTLATESL